MAINKSLEERTIEVATEVIAPFYLAFGAAYKASDIPKELSDYIYAQKTELTRAILNGNLPREAVTDFTQKLHDIADNKTKSKDMDSLFRSLTSPKLHPYISPSMADLVPKAKPLVEAAPAVLDAAHPEQGHWSDTYTPEGFVKDEGVAYNLALVEKITREAPKNLTKGKNSQPLINYVVGNLSEDMKGNYLDVIRKAIKETQDIGANAYNAARADLEKSETARSRWKKAAIGASIVAVLGMGSCGLLSKYSKPGKAVAPVSVLMYKGTPVSEPYDTKNPVQVTTNIHDNTVVVRLEDMVAIPHVPTPVEHKVTKPVKHTPKPKPKKVEAPKEKTKPAAVPEEEGEIKPETKDIKL